MGGDHSHPAEGSLQLGKQSDARFLLHPLQSQRVLGRYGARVRICGSRNASHPSTG